MGHSYDLEPVWNIDEVISCLNMVAPMAPATSNTSRKLARYLCRRHKCVKIQSVKAMSIRNLSTRFPRSFPNVLSRPFSRKATNTDANYKYVKPRKATKEEARLAGFDTNFESLAPTSGFPFILPGNVGLGWYDADTTVDSHHDFIMEQINDKSEPSGDIICRVQPCPTVLRKTVGDLFPYRNLEAAILSVVTISLKPNMKLLRKNKELETEKMAQIFVITAKGVCDMLRKGGYWADFINPFSGRPYLCPMPSDKLYEADEKFRCLDFQIFDIQHCKIVSNEEESAKRRFIGSLFTNAPSKRDHLNSIFTQF